MAQNVIKINNVEIFQPDNMLPVSYETTYTEDSGRVQSMTMIDTPMGTVERYHYQATHIPASEVSKILKMVVEKHFQLTAFFPYEGQWLTKEFYMGQTDDISIATLEEGGEYIETFSFNCQGINRLGLL